MSSFYGILIMLLLLINTTLHPVTAFWGKVDRETAILYGWNKISSTISYLKIENKVSQVVFTDYRLASLYSFHGEDYFSDDNTTAKIQQILTAHSAKESTECQLFAAY